MMESSMLPPIHQFKILRSIVKRISINMMRYFCRQKNSTKLLRKNKAMFILPILAIFPNFHLPILITPPQNQPACSNGLCSRMIQSTKGLRHTLSPKRFIASFVKASKTLAGIIISLSVFAQPRYNWLSANSARFII